MGGAAGGFWPKGLWRMTLDARVFQIFERKSSVFDCESCGLNDSEIKIKIIFATIFVTFFFFIFY